MYGFRLLLVSTGFDWNGLDGDTLVGIEQSMDQFVFNLFYSFTMVDGKIFLYRQSSNKSLIPPKRM